MQSSYTEQANLDCTQGLKYRPAYIYDYNIQSLEAIRKNKQRVREPGSSDYIWQEWLTSCDVI